MAKRYRSKKEKVKFYKKIMLVIVGFLAVCFVGGSVLKSVDGYRVKQEQEEEELGIIEYEGVKYIPKKNIATYLFMGVDSTGKVKKRTSYEESSERADVLYVMVRDLSEGTYKMLPINRNTMTEVDSIDLDGSYIATTVVQICLAHAGGDNLEMSCENTVKAVSNLLGGQQIDGYVSLNMGAIATINHLVDGVTVTIEDDFSNSDSSLKAGETVTLTDEQAVAYIHDRMNVADGTNENRMKRQSTYLEALKPKMKEKYASNSQFPLELYNKLQDYMVTDLSAKTFSKIAVLAMQDKDEGEVTIDGTTSEGELGYQEFQVDEDSLMKAKIELFYDEYE
jgi:anionic cell wall polymer biosynthesis LytR-Cps2A-Psr (LCP) family protein